MICEASSLNKYIEKLSNIFFIFGPEIVLRNNSSDQINKFFKEKGFTEKKIITENDYKDIQKVILENAGGSLFVTKTIIEILHKGGKIPKEISNIFEIKNINQMSNIILIIRSSLEKINKSSIWVKEMNALALLVQCNKLKQFEEKIWVKNQLDFMKEADAKKYTKRITDIFSGNLVAQQNEIKILKLIHSDSQEEVSVEQDEAEFLPYELEDKIIELDTNYALRIAKSIKKNDEHYAPLLVWIIGKIINVSIGEHQRKNSLESFGIWRNKIQTYKNFIKQNSLAKMMPLQRKVFELDLSSKGIGNITKEQFWQELDNLIIKLTSN